MSKRKRDLSRVHKAFAVSSILGAIIMAHNNGDPRITALKIQIDKAMRVYNVKLGRKNYYEMTDKIKEIWGKLAEKHNNTIDGDELSLFIELILNLSPRKDMKEFLMVHFTTSHKIKDYHKSAILMSVLELDEELNRLCGTVSTIDRDGLGKILVKQIKKRAPNKRTKTASKAQLKHEASAREYKERKERIASFLKKRIEAAKNKIDT